MLQPLLLLGEIVTQLPQLGSVLEGFVLGYQFACKLGKL
jgi:hypothetical protein